MVKWANDGLHQANDGKCSSMMVKWVYHTLISPSLTSISPSLTNILPSLAWSKPSFVHLTIIEKLHRLHSIVFPPELKPTLCHCPARWTLLLIIKCLKIVVVVWIDGGVQEDLAEYILLGTASLNWKILNHERWNKIESFLHDQSLFLCDKQKLMTLVGCCLWRIHTTQQPNNTNNQTTQQPNIFWISGKKPGSFE